MKLKEKLTLIFALNLLVISSNAFAEISEDGALIKSNAHHSVKLLTHGLGSLKERLDLIEQAKNTIDVEYFIYKADESGKIFTSALLKKRKEGVKIRLLLDSMLGKSDITPFIATKLIQKGIEVRYFNELNLFNGTSNKFRNHRKLLVIDNEKAMTGGRNIGNEYFDLSKKFNFFDRDLVVSGELVPKLTESFNNVWNSPWSKVPVEPNNPRNIGGKNSNAAEYNRYVQGIKSAESFLDLKNDASYEEAVNTVGARENEKSFQTSCENLSFITEKPIANRSVRDQRFINNFLLDKIKKASESIIIETPYFSMSEADEAALKTALDKKVQITMLSNGANSTDVKVTVAAVDKLLRKWLLKGISFFLFKGEKLDDYELTDKLSDKATLGLHAKTFIFDDRDIVIGTYNFDFFSAKYNGELMLECSNAPSEFINHVKDDIQKRMNKSYGFETEKDVDDITDRSVLYGIAKFLTEIFYDSVVN